MPPPCLHRTVQAAVIFLMLTGVVIGQDTVPSPERAAQVSRLIEELDTDTRAVRTRAERQLLELGPEVLPLLPPPERLPNVSVREAVHRVRLELEQRKARESVEPSRVTLRGERSLRDLLAAISRQTGNAIDASQVPDPRLEQLFAVDYDRATFWTVMDDLARRAELRYDAESTADALALQPRPTDAPRPASVAHVGAFRVVLRSAKRRPLFGREDERLLRFRLGLRAEPRLRPLFLDLAMKETAATAPALGTLTAFSPEARYELPLGAGGGRTGLLLDYRVPAVPAIARARLSLAMTVLTAAGSEAIEFRNLAEAEGVARRRGGVTVAVQRVRVESPPDESPTLKVRVAVAYDTGGPAFESHRTWMFHNRVHVTGKDGRRIEPGHFTTELQTDGGVVVEYDFRGLTARPEDLRFVYVAPTLLIRVPLRFDFPAVPVQTEAD